MEYAILRGLAGLELARVCAFNRDEVRRYMRRSMPEAVAITWMPEESFASAAGYQEKFTYRMVVA